MKDPKVNLRNMPGREVRHRLAVLEDPEVFKLRQKTWYEQWVNLGMQYWLEDQWKARMMFGSDPYIQGEEFDIAIPEPVKKRIREEMAHDLRLLETLDERLVGGPRPEDLDQLRARAASDFFNALDNDYLLELARAWKKTRDNEPQRRLEDRLVLLERVGLEAERCGFRWSRKDTGWYFDVNGGRVFGDYFFPESVNLEQVKVNFLLARACMDAAGIPRDRIDMPCNDGLDIADRHWDDPSFRKGIAVHPFRPTLQCVDALREELSTPLTMEKIQRIAGAVPVVKELREVLNRGSSPPSQPPGGRPSPGGREGSGREGTGGGGIDPKPKLPGKFDPDGRDPH